MDAELKNAPTLKDIREQNTENILRSLLRSRELARNVLASENQISIMTVNHIVDDLLAAGLVVDSCERAYSALIAERMERLLAAAHSEAIPIRVDLRQAHYDEYHQMRGCFHMVREGWIEEMAASKGRMSG